MRDLRRLAVRTILAVGFIAIWVDAANADCLNVYLGNTTLSVVCVRKMAGTGDDPPGVVGPITDFQIIGLGEPIWAGAPAADVTGRVLFTAKSADGKQGVFLNGAGPSSSISWVADHDTDPLGIVMAPLLDFDYLSLGNSDLGLTYWGRDSFGQSGIWENDVEGFPVINYRSVVSVSDPVPGTPGHYFNGVRSGTLGGLVGVYEAFQGNWVESGYTEFLPEGIFQAALVVTPLPLGITARLRIARTGDDPPGVVGPLVYFDRPATNGFDLAFGACDGPFPWEINNCALFLARNMYTSRDPNNGFVYDISHLAPVVVTGDPLPLSPNGKTTSQAFGTSDIIDINADWLGFMASSLDDSGFLQGVYVRKIGKDKANGPEPKIRKIVTTRDQLRTPQGGVYPTFVRVQAAAVDAVNYSTSVFLPPLVAFTTIDDNKNQALFVSLDQRGTRAIVPLLDSSMGLEGKRIKHISFTKEGFAFPYLAFGIEFTDGTQGIYQIELKLN